MTQLHHRGRIRVTRTPSKQLSRLCSGAVATIKAQLEAQKQSEWWAKEEDSRRRRKKQKRRGGKARNMKRKRRREGWEVGRSKGEVGSRRGRWRRSRWTLFASNANSRRKSRPYVNAQKGRRNQHWRWQRWRWQQFRSGESTGVWLFHIFLCILYWLHCINSIRGARSWTRHVRRKEARKTHATDYPRHCK